MEAVSLGTRNGCILGFYMYPGMCVSNIMSVITPAVIANANFINGHLTIIFLLLVLYCLRDFLVVGLI